MTQDRELASPNPSARQDEPSASRQLVPVSVGGCRLLVEASEIIAIERGDRIQRNPTDRPPYGWLLGTSEGLEVQSLARVLGLSDPGSGGEVLVASTADGESRGWLVDTVGDAIEVPASRLLDLEAEPALAPFVAVATIDEERCWVFSMARLGDTGSADADADSPMPDLSAAAAATLAVAPRMIWFRFENEPEMVLGLSAAQVVEIRQPAPMQILPGPPRTLCGVALLDGEVVPVANSAVLAGTKSGGSLAPGKRLLILRATRSERTVGFAVDTVEVVDLPIDNRPLPITDPLIRGAYEVGTAKLMVPDLDAVLDARYGCLGI